MLLVTSTIDANKTGHLAEKMTAVEMTSADLLLSAGEFARLRKLGFSVFQTDTDQLGTNEIADGVWDWSTPDTHLDACRSAGGQWSLAVHFHVPPPWFQQSGQVVHVRCLAHDAEFPGWSIWHGDALTFQDRGYRALRDKYGDEITALWSGAHGDYGENEYPTGYRLVHEAEAKEWRRRFGDAHDHRGWWCGDEFARADFRKAMLDKYGTLAALNDAWATNFAASEQVDYPSSVRQKRRWLDFMYWYQDSMTRYSSAVGSIAKKHMPSTRILWLLGGPDEDPRIGQDQSGLVKAARQAGVEVRSSHGGHLPFADNCATMFKRIASACKFYSVPFWSEPPYTISAAGAVGRFFEAVSCGAVVFYDWAWNPLAEPVAEKYRQYGRYLTCEKPVVDVALFYPTSHHLLNADREHPEEAYPQRFKAAAAELREVFDFDILDERMIVDGALAGHRVLVFLEGNTIERATLDAVTHWVSAGGTAVTCDLGHVETAEGDAHQWRELFGIRAELTAAAEPVSVAEEHRRFLCRLSRQDAPIADRVCRHLAPDVRILAGGREGSAVWANPLGRGWAIMFTGSLTGRRVYYNLLRDVVYNLSAFDQGKTDALAIDDEWDGVFATLFEGGKVLLYNSSPEDKRVDVLAASVPLAPESLRHVFVQDAQGR